MTRKRRAARYYVYARSLWQGDQGKLYGPYPTRAEAQQEANSRARHTSNLRDVLNTEVWTHTQCIRTLGKHFEEAWIYLAQEC